MFLIFDTETTGINSNSNVLTAYFLLVDNNYNKIDDLELKIKYDYYIIYTKALEINKINLIQHDKEAIPYNKANTLLINFLKKHNTTYKIIGHNIQFDIKMLKNNKILTENLINKYFVTPYLDTYLICKKLKKNNKISQCQSLCLNKICNYLNIKLDHLEFHDAKTDVLYSLELYKKIQELY